MVLAILPLAIYTITEEEVNWFCQNSIEVIEAEASEMSAEVLIEAKEFVTKIDNSLNLRTEFICRTDACPCYIPEGFQAWNDKFADNFDQTEYDFQGTVSNWAECEQEISNATNSAVLAN